MGKNMFNVSDLLGSDMEKRDRVEQSALPENVVVKEGVLVDIISLVLDELIKRKINGFEVNEELVIHLMKAKYSAMYSDYLEE